MKITKNQEATLKNLAANGGVADWDSGQGCKGVQIRSLQGLAKAGAIEFLAGGRTNSSRFRITGAGQAHLA